MRQLAEEFKPRNDLHAKIDEVVYLQHQVKIPAAWEAFALEAKAPLALKTVNTITAALSVNAPAVHFEPVRQGTAGEQNATAREHFFDASWLRQEEEADRQLFRIWMHHLVTHGSAVLKTCEATHTAWGEYYRDSRKLAAALDEQGYSEAERRRKYDAGTEELKMQQAYPIMTTVVSPSNFTYVPTERGFSVCVEAKDVPYYEALTSFGLAFDRGGKIVPEARGLPQDEWPHVMKGSRQTLREIEVWYWDHCEYYLALPGQNTGAATFCRSVKHSYGNALTHTLRGPYFFANGVTTSSSDNRFSGMSVIFGFLYLYPLYDAMMTGLGEGALQWAYPFLGGEQAPGRPPPPHVGSSVLVDPTGNPLASTLQLQPGMALPPGLRFIDPPRLGVDMREFMTQIRGLLELALPSVVQGVTNSDTSGYAIQQAAQLARLEWDPIVKQAERALSRRTAFESWLIENRIKERVYAWGDLPSTGPIHQQRAGFLSLGPDELQGVHRYTTRLEPETPANRVIDIRTHAEMVAQRFESWEQATEELGNSPSEVELAWLIFDLKNDPRARSKVMDATFQILDIREQQERQQAGGDLLAALGAAPAPGVGPIPGAGGPLALPGGPVPPAAAPPTAPPLAAPPPAAPPGGNLGNFGQVYTPGQGLPIQPPPATIPSHP